MRNELTKVEKFGLVKAVLEKAGADKMLVDLIDNEVSIIKNKYATNKMKKENDKNSEYAELEKAVLVAFNDNPNMVVYNDNVDLDISTSKKTAIFTRLINKGLVERVPKAKKKDKQGYKLVVKE